MPAGQRDAPAVNADLDGTEDTKRNPGATRHDTDTMPRFRAGQEAGFCTRRGSDDAGGRRAAPDVSGDRATPMTARKPIEPASARQAMVTTGREPMSSARSPIEASSRSYWAAASGGTSELRLGAVAVRLRHRDRHRQGEGLMACPATARRDGPNSGAFGHRVEADQPLMVVSSHRHASSVPVARTPP